MTLSAIEWSFLQRTRLRRWSDGCTEFEWPGHGQPPKNYPFAVMGSAHHVIEGSLGPPESSSKTACWSVQPFCTAHHSVSHYFTMRRYVPPPEKIAPSTSNAWYLRPTRVITQTASRSVQPFLYGSQMLCCTMHCQWKRKLPKLLRTDRHTYTQTDIQTYRRAHRNSSPTLPRAK